MLKAIRKRMEDREEGFTLIELMVVVLIIAILIAIAIPTFLGARKRAQDRAAQSNLRNALTAEKTYYTDKQVYSADVAATGQLKSIEPSLNYVAGTASTTSTANDVYVTANVSNGNAWVCLSVKSASNALFMIKDVATGPAGTYYASGTIAACTDDAVTGFQSSF